MENKKNSTTGMNKIRAGIGASVFMAMGIFVYVIFAPFSSEKKGSEEFFLGKSVVSEGRVGTWEVQTETRGAVEVSVQPKNISDDKNIGWSFMVSFDTHSEEINDDVANISVLRDANGKEYTPREWRGDPPGGHHRSGILLFPAVIPRPDFISFIMKRNGEEKELSFTWNIKGR